jgi:hypothetical protein
MTLTKIMEAEIQYPGDLWICPKSENHFEVSLFTFTGKFEVQLSNATESEVNNYLDGRYLLTGQEIRFNGTHHYRVINPEWSTLTQWIRAYYNDQLFYQHPQDGRTPYYRAITNKLLDMPPLNDFGQWIWSRCIKGGVERTIFQELMNVLLEYSQIVE